MISQTENKKNFTTKNLTFQQVTPYMTTYPFREEVVSLIDSLKLEVV